MKPMLVGFVALALLIVAECSAGGKKVTNNVTDFYVYCTFDSGYSIDGSVITIDTTHGTVLSADLVLQDIYGTDVATFYSVPTVSTNAAGDVEITVGGYDYSYYGSYQAWIVLTLPVKSLKKYAGGTVIANDASYWEDVTSYVDYLAAGHISP